MDQTELRISLAALHAASYAWAITCCRDRDLAEEVLQSVYVKVLDGRAPHEGRSSFRTWLFAIIRNAAWDHRRKRWWSRVLRLDFDSLSRAAQSSLPDESNDTADDHVAVVRAALNRLPERQRQVAHLVFYEDLTIKQAATAMGVTVGTARQHYARAKAALKRRLQPLWNQSDESLLR